MTESDQAPAPAIRQDEPRWIGLGLIVLGAIAGLCIHFAVDWGVGPDPSPWHAALGAFALFAAGTFALILDPARWREQAVFAVALGLIEGGLAWQLVHSGTARTASDFAPVAGIAAALIALPLFQAGAHRLRRGIDPAAAHGFAWTDAISGFGAMVFLAASWIALAVVSELFHLLKIDFLKHLIDRQWFGFTFSGAALGAALSVLREQRQIVATMQLVVMVVLSLLAVPLAVALILFLGAMILSGPQVLWEATRRATPVLMGSAIGAFVLANAVVRDRNADLPKSPVLRIAGEVLALGILPLAVFAAVSMGTRIAQHGLSPERCWALVAIIVACIWGVTYWAAAFLTGKARARLAGWPDAARRANVDMAFVALAVALFVALPIVDFGAVSARNQIARLKRGTVTPEAFDYEALRWDFGEAGRKALAGLATSRDAAVAGAARQVMREESRNYGLERTSIGERATQADNLYMASADPALRQALRALLAGDPGLCASPCYAAPRKGNRWVLVEGEGSIGLIYADGTFQREPEAAAAALAPPAPGSNPKIEIRTVPREQVFVDGKPVGPVLK